MRIASSRLPKSCGCLNYEQLGDRRRKHGGAANYKVTPEYKAWIAIKSRCFVPADARYPNYGGRGIGMHDGWRNDFPAFLAHVGKRPGSHYSLDRIDNDGHYEPGNVRWANMLKQANNTRTVRRYDIRGEMLTLSEAAAKHDIRRGLLHSRLKRGIPAERAINPEPLPVGYPAQKRAKARSVFDAHSAFANLQ